MKKLLFLLLIPVLFPACDPATPETNGGTLQINVKGSFGEKTLVLNDFYKLPDDKLVNFTSLLFYISDIKLVKENGEEVLIKDADMIDFYKNHSTASTAPLGETLTIEGVPEGEYKAIKFGIGLPASLNATNPADYSSDNPMSKTEMYWDWRGTYIFSVIEGILDETDDGIVNNDAFITIHSGSDAMFKTRELTLPISITNDAQTKINFQLDAKKIYVTNNSVFDIKNRNTSHSGPDDSDIADEIITNLANAINFN